MLLPKLQLNMKYLFLLLFASFMLALPTALMAEVEENHPNLYEPVCSKDTTALLPYDPVSITPSEVYGVSIDTTSKVVLPSDFTCQESDPNLSTECVTYSSVFANEPISSGCTSVYLSFFDICGEIGIGPARIDYVEIDITYPSAGDLIIELISPDGQRFILSEFNGSSGDNYTNTRFEDGFPSINTASAPFTGTFQPEGGSFNSGLSGASIVGTWELSICNPNGGDTGQLNSYALRFCGYNDTEPPAISCPSDQMGSFDSHCQFSIPDYRSLATVSDVIDPNPIIIQSPSPGTQINADGGNFNQPITITAVDDCGNSNQCTFEVNVNDTESPIPDEAENTGWAEAAKALASDGTGGDLFGYSVAVSGDWCGACMFDR